MGAPRERMNASELLRAPEVSGEAPPWEDMHRHSLQKHWVRGCAALKETRTKTKFKDTAKALSLSLRLRGWKFKDSLETRNARVPEGTVADTLTTFEGPRMYHKSVIF